MKKLEVGKLKGLNKEEIEVFDFLKNLDLENISSIYASPNFHDDKHHTIFYFYTNGTETIQFHYTNNQKVNRVHFWDGKDTSGSITLKENEQNEKKEKWINAIWEQLVDYFNLRIRLLFINETTPWKWNTEFTYQGSLKTSLN